MDNQRFFLLTALVLLGFWTWVEWNRHFEEPAAPAEEASEELRMADDDVPQPDQDDGAPQPSVDDDPEAADEAPAIDTLPDRPEGESIVVETARFRAEINTAAGELRRLDLQQYKERLDQPDPVRLLDDSADRLFVIQPGLIAGSNATHVPRDIDFSHDETWSINAERERVDSNEDTGKAVRLRWESPDGLVLYRTFHFMPETYEVFVSQQLVNNSMDPWVGGSYVQIERNDPQISRSMFNPTTFTHNGPAYHDTERYERLDFSDLAEENLQVDLTGGWTAMVEHYFVAALIPSSQDQPMRLYTRHRGADRYLIGLADRQGITIEPGESAEFEQTLFLGPKIQRELREAAPDLERVVDYGILWIIAQPLFVVLSWIHMLVANWGWAIIILTLLIKIAFYKLAETSGRSMAKMRKMQPRMQTIRERYKDDRQKMNQAMMELYKREKINPAAGCLPILVQIPVFIALYWVLLESAELRHAPWALWIHDLSAPDPFYILPVLMGLAMFGQFKMQPPPPDPMMRRMFMFMPLLLVAIGTVMPAGLLLYWIVNTVLTAAQQWKINRVIDRGEEN